MRTLSYRSLVLGLVLGLTACVGGVEPGDEAIAFSKHSLSIYDDNPTGNLGQTSVADTSWTVLDGRGVFKPVPGLQAAVYSRRGDNLAITVTMELQATQTVNLRALIDGVPAVPGQVTIKSGSTMFDGTRTFTFVQPLVSAGQHVVVVEAIGGDTDAVSVRRRSLSLASAAAAWGSGLLGVAGSQTTVTKNTSTWQDISGLTTFVFPEGSARLATTFSGYVLPDSGSVRVRALVDGVAIGDTLVAQAGDLTRLGARTATFTSNVAAGTHTVQVQWRVDGGSARLVGRTITAEAVRASPRGGLYASATAPTATTITSTTFVPLGNGISFVSSPGSSSAQLTWSGEVRMTGSGSLKSQLLVDGAPATWSEVTLAKGGTGWRTAGATFALDNLPAGSHQVAVQLAVSSGSSAVVGDRALRIAHKERSGAAFVHPMRSLNIDHRSYNALVICMDPLRPSIAPPTAAQIRGYYQGTDGGLSLKGWLAENSGGRADLGAVMYRGCDDGKWFQPPLEHQGLWYWEGAEGEDRFAIMRQDALAAADASFNFHAFDFNRDNRLDEQELSVYFVLPQGSAYGAVRTASAVLDGVSPALSVTGVDMYLSGNTGQRALNIGMMVHESSHVFFDAEDIYCGGGDPSFAPWRYSVMDSSETATHLDPLHKLKLGFVTPDLVDIPRWPTTSVSLADVVAAREVTILYDPARGDREYFIVEYRRSSASPYDSPVGPSAVVVWHVFEDLALAYDTRPADADTFSCGVRATSFRRVATLRDGNIFLPTWSDGSTTSIRLEVEAPLTDAFAQVLIQRLP